jgi:hypothetical protein
MTVENRIAALEDKIKDVGRKDFWDIISAIGSLLIPVAIFFAGQQYAQAMKQAEIDSENRRSASSIDVARTGSRVNQAELVLRAVDTLAGTDERRKRLAISAILIALPDEGPAIIAEVSRSDPDQQIRTYAAASLRDRRPALVAQLFDPSPGQRIAAYNTLLQTWGNDSTLPPLLAQAARQSFADTASPGRGDGIYNTLVLLSHMNRAALAPHNRDLRALADQMRPVGPRVAGRADTLVSRLP